MTSEIGIALVCLLGSFATFFSGFGLGTILLPVFSLYFSLETAILATAMVHFANNIFKLSLMSRHIDWTLFKKFGITALLGGFIGAFLLKLLGEAGTFYVFPIWGGRSVSVVAFLIGLLMLIFVYFEWKKIAFPFSKAPFFLPLGGFLSGLFGGFSGHQGALRSAFLSKIVMDKHVFVATSTLISFFIDASRISIYSTHVEWQALNWQVLVIGSTAAFVGSILGKKYLQKASISFINLIVAVFLTFMALLILTGII
ncbi:MAG: hypothetical protein RJB36_1554 [Bacteroidota bacterium]